MRRHLQGLNSAQKAAVLATEGPLLVLAGAGTGKTRVVTCRIAELLHRGVDPASLVALTFTNKAAREMRERVQQLVSGADLKAMVISTFHSLGLRVLREFAEPAGISPSAGVADSCDQLDLMAEVLRELGVRRDLLAPRDAQVRVSLWKNAALLPERAREQAADHREEILALAYHRYQETLARRRLLDFDDLILRPLLLLEESAEVASRLRGRWHYLTVDEYQDTNATQYRLLCLLASPRGNLCVVGDDDQSIYGWRGAEPDRILRFSRDFPGARVVTLEQSYRSGKSILEAANRLIRGNGRRQPKVLWSDLGPGERLRLYQAQDEKDETDFVASQISQLCKAGGHRLRGTAVLFRANSQCRPLEEALRHRRIPYRVVGTRSFFDRREVRDLLAYLRAAHNPADEGALLRIINTPPRGIGKGSVDRLLGLAAQERRPLFPILLDHRESLGGAARQGVGELVAVLEEIRRQGVERGVVASLSALLERIAYREYLQSVAADPLELEARRAVVEGLLETARSHEASGRERSPLAFLDALLLRAQDAGDDEDGGNAVTLLTMHAAKGLEFPTVFIVGVEEGLLPHRKSLPDEIEGAGFQPAIEEERRLLYVGITRAQRQVVLSYPRRRRRRGRDLEVVPSRFLEEIGLDQMEVLASEDEGPASLEAGRAWLSSIRKSLRADPDAEEPAG